MVLGLRCSTGDKVFTMFWGVGFEVFGGKVFNHVFGGLRYLGEKCLPCFGVRGLRCLGVKCYGVSGVCVCLRCLEAKMFRLFRIVFQVFGG